MTPDPDSLVGDRPAYSELPGSRPLTPPPSGPAPARGRTPPGGWRSSPPVALDPSDIVPHGPPPRWPEEPSEPEAEPELTDENTEPADPGDPPDPGDTAAITQDTEPADPGGTAAITPPTLAYVAGRSVADIAVELGLLDHASAERATRLAAEQDRPVETILADKELLSEDALARSIAERYGHSHVDLSSFSVDMAAAGLLPASHARRYRAVPVYFLDEVTLLVAVADPANVLALDDVRIMTGYDCQVAVAAESDIEALINRLGSLATAVTDAVDELDEEEEVELDDMRATADDAPVVRLVHGILSQAVNEGASDIHFERTEREMRVRFRVDGVLREVATVPRRMVAGTISRLKIMSALDIAEKRVPQDGRVGLNVDDRSIDLRMVTIPTPAGEGAVLRILDKTNVLITLEKLGIGGSQQERFEESIHKPYGAVIVTGPTGSGKSTTLYAALNVLNQVEKKIITIEDPVEYQLSGINQIQINPKAGLSFATGLRSMLRADPDIIMVGEIRDTETAKIAVEAALTGHLLLSTLHTNNAPGAIQRLTEMGVEPFLTASALDCVVAQRLARRLCDSCKRPITLTPDVLAANEVRDTGPIDAAEPVGCARCSHTGYRGRLGVYEVMRMTDRLRELTVARASGDEIAEAARAEGMVTLRDAGLQMLREGLTGLDELLRVTS